MIHMFLNFFWRVYGGFWESYARKYIGIQSVRDREGIYFIDRATGKPVLGYNGEALNPPKPRKQRTD